MKILFCIYYVLSKLFFLILHGLIPKKGGIFKKFRLKFENRIFFSPRIKRVYPIIPELKGSIESVKLITSDFVKIFGWYINPNKSNDVVIFCHGQSENISKWQDTALFLKNAGIGSFFLSYRGHYKSAGLPSEQGIYNDAETAVDFLKKRGIKTENMVFWGRSLGSSVACEMALRYNLKGVILESSITNIKSAAITMSDLYLKMIGFKNPRTFVEKLFKTTSFIQNFENDKKIKDIKCPVLILHSIEDKKIPFQVAEELHSSSKNSKLFLSKEGSHNNNYWCFDRITTFLKEINIIPDSKKINI